MKNKTLILQNAISKIEKDYLLHFGHDKTCTIDSFYFEDGCSCRRGKFLEYLHHSITTILKAAAEEIGGMKKECICVGICECKVDGYNDALDDCKAKLLKGIEE